jgi:hypothetical protein
LESDEPVFAIADALGPDVMELAPPDEKHFDGSGTALLVASAVAGAVGSGVLAAIRQAAQNGSTALIKKAAAEIRKRLSGKNVQQIFAAEGTRDSDDAAMDAAASVFAAARQALGELEAAQQTELAKGSAAAAGEALHRLGLRQEVASRVRQEIEVQISVTMRQEASGDHLRPGAASEQQQTAGGSSAARPAATDPPSRALAAPRWVRQQRQVRRPSRRTRRK